MSPSSPSTLHVSRAGAGAVLSAVVIWSFGNTLVKISDLPALTFAVHRLWLGSALVVVGLYAAGRRLTWPIVRASAPGGGVLGLEITFFFSALKHTSVADVAIISALQPALVLLLAPRMFGERVRSRDLGWAAVSVAGVVVVTIGSSGTPAWSFYGDVLAVGSLLAWTAYFLISKRARADVPAFEYMAVVFVVATLVVTPLAAIAGQPLGGLHANDLLMLLLFVIGASTGHLLLAWAHGSMDVSASSLIMLAQPVASAFAALAILGEPITPLSAAGGAIVLGALAAIVSRAASGARREEPELPQT
jgi:drug/metabolite transporter (DMT)-like permease